MRALSPVKAAVWPDAENPPLAALVELMGECQDLRVRCCYWKSSRRLEAAFAGETDLDLLIAREDQHRFQGILLRRGFKCFPAVASRDDPAVLSFLGYDEPSGRIMHVHAHFRLIVGAALLKSHRIPWEERLLERAVPHPSLPVRHLDPASEAHLLTVRSCLEMRRSDPVALRHWRALERKFEEDRAELARRVSRQALCDRAAEMLGEAVAGMIADAFVCARPLTRQRRFRRRIRSALSPYRIYNGPEAHARSLFRAVSWAAGGLNKTFLYVPRPWSRRAPGGGVVVAVLGVDGSGKTTTVAAIRAWLASEIDVMPIYFGTGGGRPSLLLLPFKLTARLITPLIGVKPKGASHGAVSERPPGRIYSALMMIWAAVVALEKRIKLTAAHRGAGRGLVVLADRYPQDEDLTYNDGPLLPRLGWAPGWLIRFEASAYALARRLPPDLVLKLDVTPETAERREPSMDHQIIRRRIEAVQRLAFPGAHVVLVDAERPVVEVLRTVKHEIWRLL